MTKRDIVKLVLDGKKPPYVPWNCGFTREALATLTAHLGTDEWETAIGNHFIKLGHSTGYVTSIGNDRYRDPFGVVWDRSIEKATPHWRTCSSSSTKSAPNPATGRGEERRSADLSRGRGSPPPYMFWTIFSIAHTAFNPIRKLCN